MKKKSKKNSVKRAKTKEKEKEKQICDKKRKPSKENKVQSFILLKLSTIFSIKGKKRRGGGLERFAFHMFQFPIST